MNSKVALFFILFINLISSSFATEIFGGKHSDNSYDLQISNNNKYEIRRNEDKLIIKNLITNTEKLIFNLKDLGEIWHGSYSLSNKLDYFVLSLKNKVSVYNIESGRLAWAIAVENFYPRVKLSPNDTKIAIDEDSYTTSIRDLATGTILRNISRSLTLNSQFANDENTFIFVNENEIVVHKANGKYEIQNLPIDFLDEDSVKISNDSKSIYVIAKPIHLGTDNRPHPSPLRGLYKIDIQTKKEKLLIDEVGFDYFKTFKFSPDEKQVAFYTQFNYIHLFEKNKFHDFKSKDQIHFRGTSFYNSSPLLFLPNNLILYATSNWDLVVKNQKTNEIIQKISTENEQIGSMHLTDEGQYLFLNIDSPSSSKAIIYKKLK